MSHTLELALVFTEGRTRCYVKKPKGALIRAMVRAGMNPEDARQAIEYLIEELGEAARRK